MTSMRKQEAERRNDATATTACPSRRESVRSASSRLGFPP